MNKSFNISLPLWLWVCIAVGITIVSTSAYFPFHRVPKAGGGITLTFLPDTVEIGLNGRLSYYASSDAALQLGDTTIYTANGTTSTWTLPPVAGYGGKFYVIVNKGSGNVTVNSNAGGNDIYDNGVASSSMVMLPGEAATIANDGQNWVTKP